MRWDGPVDLHLVLITRNDGELVGHESCRRRPERVVSELVPLRTVERIFERPAGGTPSDELPDPVCDVGRERVDHADSAILVVDDEHRAPVGEVRRQDATDRRDLEDPGAGDGLHAAPPRREHDHEQDDRRQEYAQGHRPPEARTGPP
jgi:hypothetical protein